MCIFLSPTTTAVGGKTKETWKNQTFWSFFGTLNPIYDACISRRYRFMMRCYMPIASYIICALFFTSQDLSQATMAGGNFRCLQVPIICHILHDEFCVVCVFAFSVAENLWRLYLPSYVRLHVSCAVPYNVLNALFRCDASNRQSSHMRIRAQPQQ